MTDRELEILNIISKNPMISQQELADLLGITRSSVSVYIATMMRKGIIKGRGYMIDGDESHSEEQPLCLGTLAVDFHGEVYQEEIIENSVIDNTSFAISYGGIAKNAAENLSLLGYHPTIIGPVGNDVLGKELLNECKSHGLNTDNCFIAEGYKTASYMEVKNIKNNASLISFSDSLISKTITPEILISKKSLLVKASYVLVDDSLPSESIALLSSLVNPNKIIIQITNRMKNCKDVIKKVGFLLGDWEYFCNAFSIPSNNNNYSSQFAIRIGKALLNNRMNNCIFTYGPNALVLLDNHKLYIYRYQFNDDIIELPIYQRHGISRGAMVAMIVYCKERQYSIEDTLKYIASVKHHMSTDGKVVKYTLTFDSIIKYWSFLNDTLEVITI